MCENDSTSQHITNTQFSGKAGPRCIYIGNIHIVPIYLESTTYSDEAPDVLMQHLRVVSASGKLFTLDDLARMNLGRDTVFHIGDLCRSQYSKIVATYLPKERRDGARLTGVHCDIDRKNFVRVTYILTEQHVHPFE